MALTTMDDFTFKHVNQVDEVTGDPTAFKTNMDSRGVEIRTYINGTLKDEVDAKQPLDDDLTAIAELTGTGLIAKTGAGAAQTRTITPPAAGITVTNGDGVSGNPTLALANDLAALEGLAANGMIARTGDGSATVRTITGTTNQVTVTNGDGVSGNPTLSLPQNIHNGASPTFAGMTLTGMSGVVKTSGGVMSGGATIDDVGEGTTYKRLTATKDGYINQDVKSSASPTFAGATIGSLSGVIKASGGVLSGSATLDDVPDSVTYKKMTTAKEGYINQNVTTTASPTFAGLTVDTDTVYVDKVNHRVGIGTATPTQTLDVDGNVGVQGTNVLRLGDKFTLGYNSGQNSLDISYIGA